MWDLSWNSPLGRLSMRKFLPGFVAILVAFLASLTLTNQPTYAAPDATWNNDQISYQNKLYAGPTSASEFQPVVPADAEAVYTVSNADNSAEIIYFASGSDPASATSVTYLKATYQNNVYSAPTNQRTISLAAKNASGGGGSPGQREGESACNIDAIGWIVCPVSNALAKSVDFLFETLTKFLNVEPLTAYKNDVLYKGWEYMRNLANIAFVIAFLIIIYSQVTAIGLSSYGIKKLLPRLVMAAVLMNLSYWICAIAVDLSNIAGASLQSTFMGLREGLLQGPGNSTVTTWEGVTVAALGGSAIAVGAASIIISSGGVLALLVPSLVAVSLSALVAIVVLAARQALIVVLVVLSPLAFVAFLLPNTEKYFDKWRSIFTTMLLVFPIFSLLFGGAQLAGTAIIQTSTNAVMLILGMAVQIVPVAITPFLIQLSGSLLGRIAGMVKNPNKGLVDRSRNWANGVNERQKARGEAYNPLARRWERRKRARDDRHKQVQARNDNLYHASKTYAAIDEMRRENEREAKRVEAVHDTHWNVKIRTDPAQIQREFDSRTATLKADYEKARVDTAYDEFKAGHRPIYGPMTREMTRLMDETQDASRGLALTSMRKQMAERYEKNELTNALLENQEMRTYAGGVMGNVGAESVLAGAVSEFRKEFGTNVENKKQLIKHFNLSGAQRQNLAMGNDIELEATDYAGHTYKFDVNDDYAREAAIEMQLGGAGNVENIEQIMAVSGSTLKDYKTTISSMIVDGRIGDKASYFAGKSIDDVAQGEIKTDNDITALATRAIAQGKLKPSQLAGMDATALKRVVAATVKPNMKFTKNPEDIAALDRRREALYREAYNALRNENLSGSIAENARDQLEALAAHYTPPAV